MTYNDNPWANISRAPAGQLSRLRVDAESPYTLFWFRDENNYPGLLIEISRNISNTELKEAKINIRDLTIDVFDIFDEGIRALIIKLEDQSNLDVFLKLCIDLIERASNSESSEAIFYMICQRLKKWQALFSGKSHSLLSSKEIQGLFAELCFIAEKLEEDSSLETMLIRGWEGPQKTQHDFILESTAVEIKSVAGNDRGKVRISSEDQLYTHMDKLFLRVYLLSKREDSERGKSLNNIVSRIFTMLKISGNRDLFELKLHMARYIDIPDYDIPRFQVNDCLSYRVYENFPRITRQILPEGIEAVSYDLVLASIENFMVPDVFIGD